MDNPGTDGRILIVEDSAATAKILANLLGNAGYQTDIANDGQHGLDLIASGNTPDLIIADWMMPNISGVELCKRIKHLENVPFIFIIILTNIQGKIDETLGSEVRADDYIEKPFNQKELLARIRSGMRISKLQNGLALSFRRLEEQQKDLIVAEKMASVGILVSGIAHEINNPLAIVSNAQQLLQQDVPKLFDLIDAYDGLDLTEPQRAQVAKKKKGIEFDFLKEDLRDSLHYGQKGITRIKEIIQKLQVFKTKDYMVFEAHGINIAVQKALESFPEGSFTDYEIAQDLRSAQLINCNLEQLTTALRNLFKNSLDAINRHTGRLSINTYDTAAGVHCDICDNGYGMPPEVVERIFDPFYTTKKTGAGLGLGLSTTYYILTLHQAEIKVESAPEKGTMFKIVFKRG